MASRKTVVQITPYYPPQVSGVGDHAHILCKGLEKSGYLCEILTLERTGSPARDGKIKAFNFSKSTKNALATQLKQFPTDSILLVHYVGYGYSKRGIPFGLIKTLLRWKSAHPMGKLIVMFHELQASGPWWTSTFWLSDCQKYLVKRLHDCADASFTNCLAYERELTSWGGNQPMRVEIFSTIGEPEVASSAKGHRVVLFGSPTSRSLVYDQWHLWLQPLLQLGIHEMIDIGKDVHIPLEVHSQIKVSSLGLLEQGEIREHLSASQFGLFAYPVLGLGKSSVYAAYLAHGVIPLNVMPEAIEACPLSVQLSQSVEDGYDLYQGRSIENSIEAFSRILKKWSDGANP